MKLNLKKNPVRSFSVDASNVLDTNEMIMVRGGDGDPDPIVVPPYPPKPKAEYIAPSGSQSIA